MNKPKNSKQQRKKDKEREWADVNEQVKYVCQGGKALCPFHPAPADMATVAPTVMLQDKPAMTVQDKDGKVNFNFTGPCLHPSQQKPLAPPPPCKAVVSLGEWKDFSDTMYNDNNALLVKSTITCNISGTDITIIDSGQKASLAQLKPDTGAADEAAAAEDEDEAEDEAARDTPPAIELTKLAFDTAYDVCSDNVGDFDDYKRFWVLRDGGCYYHWLKDRVDPDDAPDIKPDPIPITLSGNDTMRFEATFKITQGDRVEGLSVRAIDKEGQYEFPAKLATSYSEEFVLSFASGNTPYADTIRHLPGMELLFEYSHDGGDTWLPAGAGKVCVYVTWGTPLYEKFDGAGGDENKSMKVENKANNGAPSILETLLWLSCSSADKLTKGKQSQDEFEMAVADAIFDAFKGLKVLRAREGEGYCTPDWSGEGLGYWRGLSSLRPKVPLFSRGRSLRFLLNHGEGRCGEWSRFFLYLLLAQGISVDLREDLIGICTDLALQVLPYPYRSKRNPHVDGRLFSREFSVADAKFDKNGVLDAAKSAAQGNADAQANFGDHVWVVFRGKYFDPSYGVCYGDGKTPGSLIRYCSDNITSVYLINAASAYSRQPQPAGIAYAETHLYLNCSKDIVF